MHQFDIQAKIKKSGYTQKLIAKEFGCNEMQVSRVLKKGYGPEELIAFICKKAGIKNKKKAFPRQYQTKKKKRGGSSGN